MVVLQLGPYPPPHGGVQTNLVAIRDHLRGHGASAPVINLTRHRRANSDDVYFPRSSLEVIRLLLTIPADIIHLHIGGHLSARLLALCLVCSLVPGRRVVLTFHSGGYPSGSGRRLGRRSLSGFVMRRLDAIVAVNDEIAALFRRLGVEAARIHVICPYAPVSVPEGPLPAGLRAFCETHTPLLTTVGLLEPEYDLPLQIRTLGHVRRRFPGAGLVIIGSGSLERALAREIDAQAEGRHILLCGDVSHPHTLGVLARSDVFLRTTLYDGDSVSVREALQIGVPVVATDNGMRPAGVHLVTRMDELSLCADIEQILREPNRRQSQATDGHSLDEMIHLYSVLTERHDDLRRADARSVL